MLAEDGYKTTLNESTWMISRGNLQIGCGHKYNNLYQLMAINLEGSVNVAEKTDPNLKDFEDLVALDKAVRVGSSRVPLELSTVLLSLHRPAVRNIVARLSTVSATST